MSRVIEILDCIKAGTQYTGETHSNVEAILKAIANSAAYGKTPFSRYEELLLAIKGENEGADLIPKTRLENILVAIANDGTIPVQYLSELEKAYEDAADALKPTNIVQESDTLKVEKASAQQSGEVLFL